MRQYVKISLYCLCAIFLLAVAVNNSDAIPTFQPQLNGTGENNNGVGDGQETVENPSEITDDQDKITEEEKPEIVTNTIQKKYKVSYEDLEVAIQSNTHESSLAEAKKLDPSFQRNDKDYMLGVSKKVSEEMKRHYPYSEERFKALSDVMSKDTDLGGTIDYVFNEMQNDKELNAVVYSLLWKWNAWPDGPLGKAIQTAAILKYGLYNSSLDNWKDADMSMYESYMEEIGYVLDAMKKVTMKIFKEKGITDLTLYRGVKLREKIDEKVYKHRLSGLSSFTIWFGKAREFAPSTDESIGYILATRIPIERILSFWRTGLGTDYEMEFVVLGPQSRLDEFYIVKPKELEEREEPKERKPIKKDEFNKWVDQGKQKPVKKKDLKPVKPKEKPKSIDEELKEETQVKEKPSYYVDIEPKKSIWQKLKDGFYYTVYFVQRMLSNLYNLLKNPWMW